MKYTFLICFIVSLPGVLHSQRYYDPPVIQQQGDIYLQDTNVYYCPYNPPDSLLDTRENLCNFHAQLTDPNNLPNANYYATLHSGYFQNWNPCGGPVFGPDATWQRFFTAKRKPDGSASDIIAGSNVTDSLGHGRVIISKNEDVDFRASGRIKLKHGFRVMAGAFFHAYIDPKWDTAVFSDEFDGTTLDRSKWFVSKGVGDVPGVATMTCSSESNARDTLDSEAHDGHALDVILREDTGTFLAYEYKLGPNCTESTDSLNKHHLVFSTAAIMSCPMPHVADSAPFTAFYQHAPYGKYEIREKIPHIMHHTNNWGYAEWEWDMGETSDFRSMNERHAGFVIADRHGPFQGTFGTAAGVTGKVFRSPTAHFSTVNNPGRIFIFNFVYSVQCTMTPTDTFLRAVNPTTHFPDSLANTTNSITFWHDRDKANTTDSMHWKVDTVADGTRRKFSAAYRDSSGTLLRFTKDYQPISVTLTYDAFHHKKPFACHWEHTLNSPGDSGNLYLDDALSPSDLDSNFETYSYQMTEGEANYPTAAIPFDGKDTTGGYVYHIYTMELLPHELRYLIDSNVVRRFPDRLIPKNNKYYDRFANVPRNATAFQPAEFDVGLGSYKDSLGITHVDSLGTVPGTDSFLERQYFEQHPHNPGCGAAEIPLHSGHWYPAAHHLIDYVKIFDVPKEVIIPNFPQ